MKLTVLTMITKPDERQDMWREALTNYLSFADEVVCVNGGPQLEFKGVRMVDLPWPDEWDWQELPRHLNVGKEQCTGDWILKLDIDMMLTEPDYRALRTFLNKFDNPEIDGLKMRKLDYVAKQKYFSKNSQPILFRNRPDIGFGFVKDFPKGDMCMPMRITGWSEEYGVPQGESLLVDSTDLNYWNFSYTFKTKEVAQAHYWRMARAFKKCFQSDAVGKSPEDAWEKFMIGLESKVSRAVSHVEIFELPAEAQKLITNLTPEQKGYDAFGLMK